MAHDSSRFLPMMAEALNDIYSKVEETNNKIARLEQTFQEFIASIGQKNMILVQNLKKLQGIITELQNRDTFKNVVQSLSETINNIQDGIWFLEFQNVLTHLKEKLDEIV